MRQARCAPPRSTRRPSEDKAPAGAGPVASRLLGRERELGELTELLERARLVTLAGAPGIGKSRLAVELMGQRRAAGPAKGARLVELAPVTRPVDVARALASALSVEELPGQELTDTLLARLSERRLLVVLDNCEHLLEACAELVDALLSGCPGVRVLATSREPLGLPAELVWPLAPLAVPDAEEEKSSPEALMACPAVALFCLRASAVQPGFALNTYVAPSVAEICRRLDGIPLAIELAAARLESLTPGEIARRLADRFHLLTKASPADPPRHQTLQAALDWSHDLLSVSERALLRRLSVFVGGFDSEAAAAVCAGGPLDAGQVTDVLERLVAKSLVVADAHSSAARYRLLETIRAYGTDRLEEAGETVELRAAHARWCLALAEEAEPELTGPDQRRWLDRLEVERANLRAAIEWSLGHGEPERALRLTSALVLFWRLRGPFSEGRELLQASLSAGEGAAIDLRCRALWGAGFMTLMMADFKAAIPLLEASLAGFRELGDRGGCARALLILANANQFRDRERVLPLLSESAALAREADDSWCLAHALAIAGFERGNRDELAPARELFEDAVAVAHEARDPQGLRIGLIGLGWITVTQGDYSTAEGVLEEAVTVTRELGADWDQAKALLHLASLAQGRGQYARARELLEEARNLLGEASPMDMSVSLVKLAEVSCAEGDLRAAHDLLDQALILAPVDAPGHVTVLLGIGHLAVEEADSDTARDRFEEALEGALAASDCLGRAQALYGLGRLPSAPGETAATRLLKEALRLFLEIGSGPRITDCLESLAGLAAKDGRHEHAARLLGTAQAHRDANGWARASRRPALSEAELATPDQVSAARSLDAALAAGAALSLEQAAAEALEGPPEAGSSGRGWASLTKREQEVAVLGAEGLTNSEIADQLSITPGTARIHLSNIFLKLAIAKRGELREAVRRRG